MADLNDLTQNVSIHNDVTNADVTTTTDGAKERLDVAAKITAISISAPARVATPVHEDDGYDNDRTKISYTVPTGKVLYIQRLWASHLTDAQGHTIAFRVGSTQFYWMTFNNDGTTTFEKQYPDSNPYGPIAAGVVVTAYRIAGSSPEKWTAGLDGYLEDA